MSYRDPQAARRAAKDKARSTRAPVHIMHPEFQTYELWTAAELEDAFASGDLTGHEFRRDHLATVHP